MQGEAKSTHSVRMHVNGNELHRRVPGRQLLVDFLRREMGLTGTHVGCEHGVCGACTVLIDGRSVRACLTLTVQADGRDVVTVEALGTPDALHPLQQIFAEEHALQCGFCTAGMLMSCVDILVHHQGASVSEQRDLLSGNLCRCTGYQHIERALARAMREIDRDQLIAWLDDPPPNPPWSGA